MIDFNHFIMVRRKKIGTRVENLKDTNDQERQLQANAILQITISNI